MTKARFQRLPHRPLHLARLTGTAIALASIGVVIFLASDWLRTLGPGRIFLRHAAVAVLTMLLAIYPTAAAAATFGLALSLWTFARSRSNADSRVVGSGTRPPPGGRYSAAQPSSSSVSLNQSPEPGSAGFIDCRHCPRRSSSNPELTTRFASSSSANRVRLGVPYEGWLSVGAVVGRELERAIPSRRFHVENLAEKGATLETMHLKLARLTHRPDALIVYSGHNEFLARFSLSNRVLYYDDERLQSWGRTWLESLARLSAVARLARENLEKQQVGLVPAYAFGALGINDRPSCLHVGRRRTRLRRLRAPSRSNCR